MKNKSGSRIGRVLSRVFNFKSWFDWGRIKGWTRYFIDGLKKFFIPQEGQTKESFDKAVKRLNLSKTELNQRQQGLLRLSLVMVGLSVLLFAYTIYLLVTGGYLGAFVGLVVTLIALVLAFRYHFWYFQIKERKLGCSIQQWFQQGLMGKNNE